MPGAVGERFDFFFSRRGSVAEVAREGLQDESGPLA
jgi:hypothetical protein